MRIAAGDAVVTFRPTRAAAASSQRNRNADRTRGERAEGVRHHHISCGNVCADVLWAAQQWAMIGW